SSSKSTYVSLARKMRAFTVQIHDHHEEAQLDTIQLSKSTDLKQALLRMPKIVSVDLQDLPAVLAEPAPFEMKGELNASLNLDMDHEYWTHGPLHAVTKGFQVSGGGIEANANLKLDSEVRFNPKLKTNQLQKFTLRTRDANLHIGARDVNGWWMDIESTRFTYWNKDPSAFDGTFGVQARDLDPVLKSLAEKDVISELIPMFTSLNDFRASARVRGAGEMTDVTLASESQVWDASGRVFKKGDKTQFAIVVGGQAVSLGVASKGDGLELMPFAKTGWLNEHLREFPKPIVEMKPDKP
ncbi:MAG TPA: hypothetical protein VHM25_05905, partial [Polyangiaceae bacterium]|nr:hypothetical protein [Polyangiaceae bacterium]